jgi:predicted transcriptional regulator
MDNDNSDHVERSELLALTSDIVSSHVSNNSVGMADLPALIEQVFNSLEKLGSAGKDPIAEKPKPAVPIRRSITPDYIVCLEDGKKLKMLKRHLRTAYDMTPEEYRERWGLPADYPMVAPNYAAQRRTLAKKIGLGTQRGKRKKK